MGGRCYFCDGKVVDGQNGTYCTQCGDWFHGDCLKKNGLTESGGLLSSAKAKCPSCGHVGKV
ncbi:hypothetical protein [Halolamina salina]|uniref:PHD-type domain-containing protein n=1 Tax=Halolamina salina TaxID=1220023 RepID=A0ABD6B3B4_9EURY